MYARLAAPCVAADDLDLDPLSPPRTAAAVHDHASFYPSGDGM